MAYFLLCKKEGHSIWEYVWRTGTVNNLVSVVSLAMQRWGRGGPSGEEVGSHRKPPGFGNSGSRSGGEADQVVRCFPVSSDGGDESCEFCISGGGR